MYRDRKGHDIVYPTVKAHIICPLAESVISGYHVNNIPIHGRPIIQSNHRPAFVRPLVVIASYDPSSVRSSYCNRKRTFCTLLSTVHLRRSRTEKLLQFRQTKITLGPAVI